MLFYYITDRTAFPGDEFARRRQLLDKIAEAALAGVSFIQLREKDLSTRELESLTRDALGRIRSSSRETGNRKLETRLLINSRTDLALAAGADGVHLRSNDVSPVQVREIAAKHDRSSKLAARSFVIAVSCHSESDVTSAQASGADFAVFAPVFEKKDSTSARPTGLDALRQACRHKVPVLALGGVTLENVGACLEAGASGIAAIRLFQENDIAKIVAALR